MILHYLKTAFRSSQRNKLYSVLIIGGFAVGFAVCIIIGLYAYSEFSVDTGIKDHERIYRLVDVDSKFFDEKTTAFDYNLGNILNSSLKNYQKIHDQVELQPISYIYLHSDDIQDAASYTKKGNTKLILLL